MSGPGGFRGRGYNQRGILRNQRLGGFDSSGGPIHNSCNNAPIPRMGGFNPHGGGMSRAPCPNFNPPRRPPHMGPGENWTPRGGSPQFAPWRGPRPQRYNPPPRQFLPRRGEGQYNPRFPCLPGGNYLLPNPGSQPVVQKPAIPHLGSEEERKQKITEAADALKLKLSASTTEPDTWRDDDDDKLADVCRDADHDSRIVNKGIPELKHDPPELNLTLGDLRDIGRVDHDHRTEMTKTTSTNDENFTSDESEVKILAHNPVKPTIEIDLWSDDNHGENAVDTTEIIDTTTKDSTLNVGDDACVNNVKQFDRNDDIVTTTETEKSATEATIEQPNVTGVECDTRGSEAEQKTNENRSDVCENAQSVVENDASIDKIVDGDNSDAIVKETSQLESIPENERETTTQAPTDISPEIPNADVTQSRDNATNLNSNETITNSETSNIVPEKTEYAKINEETHERWPSSHNFTLNDSTMIPGLDGFFIIDETKNTDDDMEMRNDENTLENNVNDAASGIERAIVEKKKKKTTKKSTSENFDTTGIRLSDINTNNESQAERMKNNRKNESSRQFRDATSKVNRDKTKDRATSSFSHKMENEAKSRAVSTNSDNSTVRERRDERDREKSTNKISDERSKDRYNDKSREKSRNSRSHDRNDKNSITTGKNTDHRDRNRSATRYDYSREKSESHNDESSSNSSYRNRQSRSRDRKKNDRRSNSHDSSSSRKESRESSKTDVTVNFNPPAQPPNVSVEGQRSNNPTLPSDFRPYTPPPEGLLDTPTAEPGHLPMVFDPRISSHELIAMIPPVPFDVHTPATAVQDFPIQPGYLAQGMTNFPSIVPPMNYVPPPPPPMMVPPPILPLPNLPIAPTIGVNPDSSLMQPSLAIPLPPLPPPSPDKSNLDMDDGLEDMQEAMEFAKQFMNMNETSEIDSNFFHMPTFPDLPPVPEIPSLIPEDTPRPPSTTVNSDRKEITCNRDKDEREISNKIEISCQAKIDEKINLDNDAKAVEKLAAKDVDMRPKVIFNVNSKPNTIINDGDWKNDQDDEETAKPVAATSTATSEFEKIWKSNRSTNDRVESKESRILDNKNDDKMSTFNGINFQIVKTEQSQTNPSSTSSMTTTRITKQINERSTITNSEKIDINPRKITKESSTPRKSTDDTPEASWKSRVIGRFLKMSKNDICNMLNNTSLRKFDIAMKHLVKERRSSLSLGMRNNEEEKLKDTEASYNREEFMDQLSAMLDPSATVDLCNLPTQFIHHLNEVLHLDSPLECDTTSTPVEQSSAIVVRQSTMTNSTKQTPVSASPRQTPSTSSPRQTHPSSSPRQTPSTSSPRQTPSTSSPRQTHPSSSPRQSTVSNSTRNVPPSLVPRQAIPASASRQASSLSSPRSSSASNLSKQSPSTSVARRAPTLNQPLLTSSLIPPLPISSTIPTLQTSSLTTTLRTPSSTPPLPITSVIPTLQNSSLTNSLKTSSSTPPLPIPSVISTLQAFSMITPLQTSSSNLPQPIPSVITTRQTSSLTNSLQTSSSNAPQPIPSVISTRQTSSLTTSLQTSSLTTPRHAAQTATRTSKESADPSGIDDRGTSKSVKAKNSTIVSSAAGSSATTITLATKTQPRRVSKSNEVPIELKVPVKSVNDVSEVQKNSSTIVSNAASTSVTTMTLTMKTQSRRASRPSEVPIALKGPIKSVNVVQEVQKNSSTIVSNASSTSVATIPLTTKTTPRRASKPCEAPIDPKLPIKNANPVRERQKNSSTIVSSASSASVATIPLSTRTLPRRASKPSEAPIDPKLPIKNPNAVQEGQKNSTTNVTRVRRRPQHHSAVVDLTGIPYATVNGITGQENSNSLSMADLDDIFTAGIARAKKKNVDPSKIETIGGEFYNNVVPTWGSSNVNLAVAKDPSVDGVERAAVELDKIFTAGIAKAKLASMQAAAKATEINDTGSAKDVANCHRSRHPSSPCNMTKCEKWNRRITREGPDTFRNLTKEEWEAKYGETSNSTYEREYRALMCTKCRKGGQTPTNSKDDHEVPVQEAARGVMTRLGGVVTSESDNLETRPDNDDVPTNVHEKNKDEDSDWSSTSASSTSESSANEDPESPSVTQLLKVIKEREKTGKKKTINEEIRDEVTAEMERKRREKVSRKGHKTKTKKNHRRKKDKTVKHRKKRDKKRKKRKSRKSGTDEESSSEDANNDDDETCPTVRHRRCRRILTDAEIKQENDVIVIKDDPDEVPRPKSALATKTTDDSRPTSSSSASSVPANLRLATLPSPVQPTKTKAQLKQLPALPKNMTVSTGYTNDYPKRTVRLVKDVPREILRKIVMSANTPVSTELPKSSTISSSIADSSSKKLDIYAYKERSRLRSLRETEKLRLIDENPSSLTQNLLNIPVNPKKIVKKNARVVETANSSAIIDLTIFEPTEKTTTPTVAAKASKIINTTATPTKVNTTTCKTSTAGTASAKIAKISTTNVTTSTINSASAKTSTITNATAKTSTIVGTTAKISPIAKKNATIPKKGPATVVKTPTIAATTAEAPPIVTPTINAVTAKTTPAGGQAAATIASHEPSPTTKPVRKLIRRRPVITPPDDSSTETEVHIETGKFANIKSEGSKELKLREKLKKGRHRVSADGLETEIPPVSTSRKRQRLITTIVTNTEESAILPAEQKTATIVTNTKESAILPAEQKIATIATNTKVSAIIPTKEKIATNATNTEESAILTAEQKIATIATNTKESAILSAEQKIATNTGESAILPAEQKIATNTEESAILPAEQKIATNTEESAILPAEQKIATNTEESAILPAEKKIATNTEESAILPSEQKIAPIATNTEKSAILSTERKIEETPISKRLNYFKKGLASDGFPDIVPREIFSVFDKQNFKPTEIIVQNVSEPDSLPLPMSELSGWPFETPIATDLTENIDVEDSPPFRGFAEETILREDRVLTEAEITSEIEGLDPLPVAFESGSDPLPTGDVSQLNVSISYDAEEFASDPAGIDTALLGFPITNDIPVDSENIDDLGDVETIDRNVEDSTEIINPDINDLQSSNDIDAGAITTLTNLSTSENFFMNEVSRRDSIPSLLLVGESATDINPDSIVEDESIVEKIDDTSEKIRNNESDAVNVEITDPAPELSCVPITESQENAEISSKNLARDKEEEKSNNDSKNASQTVPKNSNVQNVHTNAPASSSSSETIESTIKETSTEKVREKSVTRECDGKIKEKSHRRRSKSRERNHGKTAKKSSRHRNHRRDGKKKFPITEKFVDEAVKANIVKLVSKPTCKDTVMARMIEIDVEIHKLMNEKMTLYKMLESGVFPAKEEEPENITSAKTNVEAKITNEPHENVEISPPRAPASRSVRDLDKSVITARATKHETPKKSNAGKNEIHDESVKNKQKKSSQRESGKNRQRKNSESKNHPKRTTSEESLRADSTSTLSREKSISSTELEDSEEKSQKRKSKSLPRRPSPKRNHEHSRADNQADGTRENSDRSAKSEKENVVQEIAKPRLKKKTKNIEDAKIAVKVKTPKGKKSIDVSKPMEKSATRRKRTVGGRGVIDSDESTCDVDEPEAIAVVDEGRKTDGSPNKDDVSKSMEKSPAKRKKKTGGVIQSDESTCDVDESEAIAAVDEGRKKNESPIKGDVSKSMKKPAKKRKKIGGVQQGVIDSDESTCDVDEPEAIAAVDERRKKNESPIKGDVLKSMEKPAKRRKKTGGVQQGVIDSDESTCDVDESEATAADDEGRKKNESPIKGDVSKSMEKPAKRRKKTGGVQQGVIDSDESTCDVDESEATAADDEGRKKNESPIKGDLSKSMEKPAKRRKKTGGVQQGVIYSDESTSDVDEREAIATDDEGRKKSESPIKGDVSKSMKKPAKKRKKTGGVQQGVIDSDESTCDVDEPEAIATDDEGRKKSESPIKGDVSKSMKKPAKKRKKTVGGRGVIDSDESTCDVDEPEAIAVVDERRKTDGSPNKDDVSKSMEKSPAQRKKKTGGVIQSDESTCDVDESEAIAAVDEGRKKNESPIKGDVSKSMKKPAKKRKKTGGVQQGVIDSDESTCDVDEPEAIATDDEGRKKSESPIKGDVSKSMKKPAKKRKKTGGVQQGVIDSDESTCDVDEPEAIATDDEGRKKSESPIKGDVSKSMKKPAKKRKKTGGVQQGVIDSDESTCDVDEPEAIAADDEGRKKNERPIKGDVSKSMKKPAKRKKKTGGVQQGVIDSDESTCDVTEREAIATDDEGRKKNETPIKGDVSKSMKKPAKRKKKTGGVQQGVIYSDESTCDVNEREAIATDEEPRKTDGSPNKGLALLEKSFKRQTAQTRKLKAIKRRKMKKDELQRVPLDSGSVETDDKESSTVVTEENKSTDSNKNLDEVSEHVTDAIDAETGSHTNELQNDDTSCELDYSVARSVSNENIAEDEKLEEDVAKTVKKVTANPLPIDDESDEPQNSETVETDSKPNEEATTTPEEPTILSDPGVTEGSKNTNSTSTNASDDEDLRKTPENDTTDRENMENHEEVDDLEAQINNTNEEDEEETKVSRDVIAKSAKIDDNNEKTNTETENLNDTPAKEEELDIKEEGESKHFTELNLSPIDDKSESMADQKEQFDGKESKNSRPSSPDVTSANVHPTDDENLEKKEEPSEEPDDESSVIGKSSRNEETVETENIRSKSRNGRSKKARKAVSREPTQKRKKPNEIQKHNSSEDEDSDVPLAIITRRSRSALKRKPKKSTPPPSRKSARRNEDGGKKLQKRKREKSMSRESSINDKEPTPKRRNQSRITSSPLVRTTLDEDVVPRRRRRRKTKPELTKLEMACCKVLLIDCKYTYLSPSMHPKILKKLGIAKINPYNPPKIATLEAEPEIPRSNRSETSSPPILSPEILENKEETPIVVEGQPSSPRERPSSSRERSASPRERPSSSRERSASPRERPSSSRERSASPRERPSSSRERSASPRDRSSSKERSSSPRERPSSPRERSASPRDRSASPRDRSASPRERSSSPRERSPSPRQRSPSPKERSTSPKERSTSPKERPPSPKERSTSAKERSTSAKERSFSPDERSSSSLPVRERSSSLTEITQSPKRPPTPVKLISSSERVSASPTALENHVDVDEDDDDDEPIQIVKVADENLLVTGQSEDEGEGQEEEEEREEEQDQGQDVEERENVANVDEEAAAEEVEDVGTETADVVDVVEEAEASSDAVEEVENVASDVEEVENVASDVEEIAAQPDSTADDIPADDANEDNPNDDEETKKMENTKNKEEPEKIISRDDEPTVIQASPDSEAEDDDNEPRRTRYTVHKGPILDIKVLDDSFLAASEDGSIYRYSQKSNGILNIYKGHEAAVTCIYVFEGGGNCSKLYSGSLDGTFRCYNITSGAQERPPALVGSPIQCMDQAWGVIFVGTKSGHISRYSIKSGSIKGDRLEFSDKSVLALKASAEGPRRVLIVASRNQPITIRDALTGLFLRTIAGYKNHTVYSLMRERNLVYCGTSSTSIPVFDFTNGEEITQYNAGVGIVCMRLYRQILFAGCYDGNIYVFDTKSTKLICSIPGPGNMLLSMEIVDDEIIAGSKNRQLHSWRMPRQVRALLSERT